MDKETDRPIISKDSLIPLGLVMTLIGAAVSFGFMYNQVLSMKEDLADIRIQQTENTKLLNRLAGQLGVSLTLK